MTSPHTSPKESRLAFDTTINLPTLIAVIGLAGTGFGVWSDTQKRIVVLEEFAKAQTAKETAAASAQRDRQIELVQRLDKVDRSIERINDRLDYRAPIARGPQK